MVGGMGDQETQVEQKVIASSPGLRELKDHKEQQFQSLWQVYRLQQDFQVGNMRMLLKMVTMMTRTILTA